MRTEHATIVQSMAILGGVGGSKISLALDIAVQALLWCAGKGSGLPALLRAADRAQFEEACQDFSATLLVTAAWAVTDSMALYLLGSGRTPVLYSLTQIFSAFLYSSWHRKRCLWSHRKALVLSH